MKQKLTISEPLTLSGILIGAVCLFLLFLKTTLFIDYDEIYYAHVTWLIAQGRLPMLDFYECHPPLLYFLHQPLIYLAEELPAGFSTFRFGSLLCNAVFIFFVYANARLGQSKTPIVYFAIACAGLFAALGNGPGALQFRPDSLANALLLLTIFVFRRIEKRSFKRCFLFAFSAMFILLMNPKLALFIQIISIIDLIKDQRAGLNVFRQFSAYVIGVIAGSLAMMLIIKALGMSPADTFRMSFEYHIHFNASFHGYGLLLKLLRAPVLLGVCVVGMIGTFVTQRNNLLAYDFELSVVFFVASQILLVRFDWVQYSFPCFVLMSIFFAHGAFLLAKKRPSWEAPIQRLLALILLGLLAYNGWTVAGQSGVQESHVTFLQRVKAIKKAGGTVLTVPPFHPMSEDDALYHWFAFDLKVDQIVREKLDKRFGARFAPEFYKAELEREKPALIISADNFQFHRVLREVVGEYLRRHRSEYVLRRVTFYGNTQIVVWVHIDYLQER